MTAQEIFDLAMCYYSGTNGLEKDMDKYVELLEEAASLEHVEAAYLLACWYEWKATIHTLPHPIILNPTIGKVVIMCPHCHNTSSIADYPDRPDRSS